MIRYEDNDVIFTLGRNVVKAPKEDLIEYGIKYLKENSVNGFQLDQNNKIKELRK